MDLSLERASFTWFRDSGMDCMSFLFFLISKKSILLKKESNRNTKSSQ